MIDNGGMDLPNGAEQVVLGRGCVDWGWDVLLGIGCVTWICWGKG